MKYGAGGMLLPRFSYFAKVCAKSQRQPVWAGALLAWETLRRKALGLRPKPRQGVEPPAPRDCAAPGAGVYSRCASLWLARCLLGKRCGVRLWGSAPNPGRGLNPLHPATVPLPERVSTAAAPARLGWRVACLRTLRRKALGLRPKPRQGGEPPAPRSFSASVVPLTRPA